MNDVIGHVNIVNVYFCTNKIRLLKQGHLFEGIQFLINYQQQCVLHTQYLFINERFYKKILLYCVPKHFFAL